MLKRNDVDMAQGGILKSIVLFALPLLAGNLFQQLYNMVDTWVIGHSGENGAYAAVGSVGPIMNILIGSFLGLSSGVNVVIAQYYGAKDYEKVEKAVHTSITITLILAVIFTILGVCMTPFMLNLMLKNEGSNGAIYPFAKTYLTIYFSGVSGLMIYNMGAGILRAVGDSKNPFRFLVISAIINTVLDLFFVFKLHMGVAGVAIATIVAQFVSAVITLFVLINTPSCIRLNFKKLCIDKEILKRIFKIGIPAALQMAITAFSNVFVQSYIANVNADRTFCLGGWTTYSKVDQFIFLPLQSIALSATTFVGQNFGMGSKERAKKGTYVAYLLATCTTILIICIVMIFAPSIAKIFNADKDVVSYASLLLRLLTPFYLLCCVNQVFTASLRGLGNSSAPMIIMLTSFVVCRQIYLFITTHFFSNEIVPVAMSYPVGWFICAVSTLIYYYNYNKKI